MGPRDKGLCLRNTERVHFSDRHWAVLLQISREIFVQMLHVNVYTVAVNAFLTLAQTSQTVLLLALQLFLTPHPFLHVLHFKQKTTPL